MICKYCGEETGKKGNHIFVLNCVRAMKNARSDIYTWSGNLFLLLARLHSKAVDALPGYSGSEMSIEIADNLRQKNTKRDKYARMAQENHEMRKALHSVGIALAPYIEKPTDQPSEIIKGAQKAAYYLSFLHGRGKNIVDFQYLESRGMEIEMILGMIRKLKNAGDDERSVIRELQDAMEHYDNPPGKRDEKEQHNTFTLQSVGNGGA